MVFRQWRGVDPGSDPGLWGEAAFRSRLFHEREPLVVLLFVIPMFLKPPCSPGISGSGATWRSGYATVCKTVYSGSIPDVASN